MSKPLQTITKLDTNGFKPIPNRTSLEKAYNIMYENLWSMFDIPDGARDEMWREDKSGNIKRAKRKTDNCRQLSVSDFAWTKEVKESFYEWADHKRTVKHMKNIGGMTWGMWVLQSEPSEPLDGAA